MADSPRNLMEMFQQLGEQLKVPFFDMSTVLEHHRKNFEAATRSWQALASGSQEIAQKQREIVEGVMKDVTVMVQGYKPVGAPHEVFAKQSEFARKAMEAAMTNTRDIAQLAQKSGGEALAIIQERMRESYDEIRAGLEKR
jgi:phasin family protein